MSSDTNENFEEILDRKLGVLVEHMNDQFGRVLDAVDDMQQQVQHIPKIQEDISELKAAVKDTNKDLQELDVRVDQLEASA